MDVVVVESPAKAKTINKYLGSNYVVLASYGHVRDLPPKDGSVLPDRDFEIIYETGADSKKHLREIAKHAKKAETLYLATDPDREGEAISWHVLRALEEDFGVKDAAGKARRIVFNEITKRAVQEGLAQPRRLDDDLINAQQARRALDYLVGFNISPVLWRKLPGARSAGRVQSVALRLICDREREIEAFVAREYWSVAVDFETADGAVLQTRLTHLDGNKLDRFDLGDEAAAKTAVAAIEAGSFAVASVETKPVQRHPAPPFTTSTLQQEASRKLRMGARRTMQLAQQLYEGTEIDGETVGLITYMRTDGVSMAQEAIEGARALIGQRFGDAFVPEKPREYRSKAKNAQEAHEAIRPTDLTRTPDEAARYLDREQLRLYELVWQRAVASQMASARLSRTTVEVADGPERRTVLRATGTVVDFPGFLKLYEEGRDDAGDDDEDRRLPRVAERDPLATGMISPEQHFTEPPPRFSEATLVKRLEELGIGRPSTYAAILSVLQDREYVRLDKRRFLPEDRGRIVTAFLTRYFPRYVDYNFTARLEDQLDDVSGGRLDWKSLLRDFWRDFKPNVDDMGELRVRDVLDAVSDLILGPGDGEARRCPVCGEGVVGVRGGRNGFFLGCSRYPECRYTRNLVAGEQDEEQARAAAEGPEVLGIDPESGLEVTRRFGPFGPYLQLGEPDEEGNKPKRVSIPKDIAPGDCSLELALRLLALPRRVGHHPETDKVIAAGIGRFGPYLRYDQRYFKLDGAEEALTIGLNHAVTKIAEAPPKGARRGPEALRQLGDHPELGGPVAIYKGRYGPYVKHGDVNATIPDDVEPEELAMEQAVELIAARAARQKKKPARKAAAKKTATRKTAAKKKTAGKTAAKKKAPAKKTAAGDKTPASEG